MSVVARCTVRVRRHAYGHALYEEEKRPHRTQHAGAFESQSGDFTAFVGGEIQRMLSQALDRVLGRCALACWSLFLHHGDPQGPTFRRGRGLER